MASSCTYCCVLPLLYPLLALPNLKETHATTCPVLLMGSLARHHSHSMVCMLLTCPKRLRCALGPTARSFHMNTHF